jgi:hypothetical protein
LFTAGVMVTSVPYLLASAPAAGERQDRDELVRRGDTSDRR